MKMQYKNTQKIIIDKRKLDVLLRLGNFDTQLLELIKTGTFTKTGDDLVDDTLECLIDVKLFKNWGGKRDNAGRPPKNHLEKQLDNQDENQDAIQVVDKDKDKDIERYIKGEIIKEGEEKIQEAVNKWVAYKKERRQSYTKTGLKQCIEKLKKMSNDNPVIAMQIVNESISNNWSGLFPLKSRTPQTKSERINEHNLEFIRKAWGC